MALRSKTDLSEMSDDQTPLEEFVDLVSDQIVTRLTSVFKEAMAEITKGHEALGDRIDSRLAKVFGGAWQETLNCSPLSGASGERRTLDSGELSPRRRSTHSQGSAIRRPPPLSTCREVAPTELTSLPEAARLGKESGRCAPVPQGNHADTENAQDPLEAGPTMLPREVRLSEAGPTMLPREVSQPIFPREVRVSSDFAHTVSQASAATAVTDITATGDSPLSQMTPEPSEPQSPRRVPQTSGSMSSLASYLTSFSSVMSAQSSVSAGNGRVSNGSLKSKASALITHFQTDFIDFKSPGTPSSVEAKQEDQILQQFMRSSTRKSLPSLNSINPEMGRGNSNANSSPGRVSFRMRSSSESLEVLNSALGGVRLPRSLQSRGDLGGDESVVQSTSRSTQRDMQRYMSFSSSPASAFGHTPTGALARCGTRDAQQVLTSRNNTHILQKCVELDDTEDTRKPLIMPMICGVLPWSQVEDTSEGICHFSLSRCYQVFVMLLAVCSCAMPIQSIASKQHDSQSWCLSSTCLESEYVLCDLALALGSLLGLGTCVYCTQGLVENVHLLQCYAQFADYGDRWLKMVYYDLKIALLLWVLAVAERARGIAIFSDADMWGMLNLFGFAVSSLIVCAMTCCILYLCRGMSCSVDSYCLSVVEHNSFDQAVPRWNAVQALLRKIGLSLHSSLCILQMTVFVMAMTSCISAYRSTQADDGNVFLLTPTVLVMLSTVRILFKAAEVTDRCTRVPPLINACTVGPDLEDERQYLVQYVLQSCAGFYMFKIRVTSDTTIKFVHFCGVAVFIVVTQLFQ